MRKRKNKRIAFSGQRVADKTQLFAKRYTLSAKNGFTLIELLIATSILGVIGLTILATFGSGFHVYQRVQTYGGVQANVLLALEEIEQNLRNAIVLSTIRVEGDSQAIAIPAIIESVEIDKGEERIVSSVGRVSYFFDDAAESLIKTEQDYAQVISKINAREDQTESLATIDGMTISYYSYDEEEKTYNWSNLWDVEETSSLIGVKFELTYKDGNRDIEIARMVFMTSSPKVLVEEHGEEGEEEG